MKKIANWLLWIAIVCGLSSYIYAFYLNITKTLVDSTIAEWCFYITLAGAALFLAAIGLYISSYVKTRRSVEWKKAKPKRDAERTGRRELAKYRMKHRYFAVIINILFIAGMVAWGWNTSGWLVAVAILCIFGSVLVFGYYMYRMDKKDIKQLNEIRERYDIPLKDVNLTFWQFFRNK